MQAFRRIDRQGHDAWQHKLLSGNRGSDCPPAWRNGSSIQIGKPAPSVGAECAATILAGSFRSYSLDKLIHWFAAGVPGGFAFRL
jgi:hypothetical protein